MDYVRACLERYGSGCTAYSTLDPCMEHFIVDGLGYIAYRTGGWPGATAFVLSGPVASPAGHRLLIERFLERFPKAAFLQAAEGTARILAEKGFYVNEMGVETEIRLPCYTYRGRKKESLRRMTRRALESGVRVIEVEDPAPCAGRFKEISREWMRTKRIRWGELSFLARRPVYRKEPDVRVFATKEGREVTGFVVFDPMYREGRVYGYTASILRTSRRAHPGTLTLIIKEAIEVFRGEGAEVLSLGLSPLFLVDDRDSGHNPVMKGLFRLLYSKGSFIFPFRNLAFTKSRYGGGLSGAGYRDPAVAMRKVYFVHRSVLPFDVLLGAARVTGVTAGLLPIPRSLLLPGRGRSGPAEPQGLPDRVR